LSSMTQRPAIELAHWEFFC